MRTGKKILSLFPLLVLWLMLSALLWGFVFSHITDTRREEKITVCIDAQVPRATELAMALEEKLAGRIRMVKVRPFAYAMFDESTLTQADLFIVPFSHAEDYEAWFDSLPEEMAGNENILTRDSKPWGMLVFDAETGVGAASTYIDYTVPGETAESFYLFFGKESLHVKGHENAADNLAADTARLLMEIE